VGQYLHAITMRRICIKPAFFSYSRGDALLNGWLVFWVKHSVSACVCRGILQEVFCYPVCSQTSHKIASASLERSSDCGLSMMTLFNVFTYIRYAILA